MAEVSQSGPQWSLSYASYTPKELEEITGLSTDMQRVWRRRGQLPAIRAGHARFTPTEAIEIAIRYALSKVGLSPSESRIMETHSIGGAIYHALRSADGTCEIVGPESSVAQFRTEFEDSEDLAMQLAGWPEATNYLILDDEDRLRVVDDANDVFDWVGMTIVAVDLRVVGTRLVELGRKPIMAVTFPSIAGERTVRKLTGII